MSIEREEYERLCQEIKYHNQRYYVESHPEISDEAYDLLFKQVEQIEKNHPEWLSADSPTKQIGEQPTKGFQQVVHCIPMLSLANTYSKQEIQDFIQRLYKLTNKKELKFSCELKMDGIAVTAIYENGYFKQGMTRGDGKKGDDITVNMQAIGNLPHQLIGESLPAHLEVRGEVFMAHEIFNKMNQERSELGEALWANPRNAAAGSLKLLDPQEVAKRQLQVVFYGIADLVPAYHSVDSSPLLASQFESHSAMKRWGLPTLQILTLCHSIEEIEAFTEKVQHVRASLPFDIDGVVIKLDELKEQQKLGTTGKNPRWAIAYKFAAEQALTQITAITIQLGRTGVLTPVAELEPVLLAGSKIARATLHNEEEIQRKDIRVGDFVYIEKGGDVIPKVLSVDLNKRLPNRDKWSMPLQCPECDTPVIRLQGEVAVRCPNQQTCPAQLIKRIEYFASKPAMDIEGMGEKVVEQLVKLQLVTRLSDIYQLREEQLYQLNNFKIKAVHNLMKGINSSRQVALDKFIMALGIKYVGAGIANELVKKCGSLRVLMQMTKEELLQIESIGEKVATSLKEYFENESQVAEIERLLALGVTPHVTKVTFFDNHLFKGKSLVLTGSLEKYTRQTAALLIKERGGKVVDAVSKKTDFLIAGQEAGSKLDKAQNLGIKILTEKEFETLLN